MESSARLPTIVLVLIVAFGAGLRLWGIAFGLPFTQARPDESQVINLATRIANGDLNPHYFVYPTLYMYLLAALFRIESTLFHVADAAALSISALFLTDRVLAAVFGSATVAVAYLLGRSLRDRMTGLLAAAFLAASFLHVRDSHFGTTDVPMTCVAAVAVLLLLVRDRRVRSMALAGFVAGLATSLKYNAAMVAAVPLFLEVHAAATQRDGWGSAARRIATFAALMAVGFLAGTPYALLDRRTFLAGVSYIGEHFQTGHIYGTHVLSVENAASEYGGLILPAAVGWPAYLAALLGSAVIVLRERARGVAFLLFPALYFGTAARGHLVFARYALPLVPFLCVAAAYLVRVAVEPVRAGGLRAVAATVIALVLLLPSAAAAVRVDMLLTRLDNRLVVGRWADEVLRLRTSVWQSGSRFGRVPLDPERLDLWDYDEESATFKQDGRARGHGPEYIFVQRSPLEFYSSCPAAVTRLLESRYVRVASFRTGLGALPAADFDISDAFFLPLKDLQAVRRPGPEFDIYQMRADGSTNHD